MADCLWMKMPQLTKFYISFILLISLSACDFLESVQLETKLITVSLAQQDFKIFLEVVETEKQRAQGLMFRRFLPADNGMLFIYERMQILDVWMKNTVIPLDVIFISDQGQIVSLIRALKPCKQDPCKIYSSTNKARYMLEVNAGLIDKKALEIGQILVFDGV